MVRRRRKKRKISEERGMKDSSWEISIFNRYQQENTAGDEKVGQAATSLLLGILDELVVVVKKIERVYH